MTFLGSSDEGLRNICWRSQGEWSKEAQKDNRNAHRSFAWIYGFPKIPHRIYGSKLRPEYVIMITRKVMAGRQTTSRGQILLGLLTNLINPYAPSQARISVILLRPLTPLLLETYSHKIIPIALLPITCKQS